MKYKFFKKGSFESLDKFEKRLNEEASLGWRVINIVTIGGYIAALMERVNKDTVY